MIENLPWAASSKGWIYFKVQNKKQSGVQQFVGYAELRDYYPNWKQKSILKSSNWKRAEN